MKFLLVPVLAIPIIYLIVALTLALLPVQRSESGESLDFDMLRVMGTAEFQIVETDFIARDGDPLFICRMVSRLLI